MNTGIFQGVSGGPRRFEPYFAQHAEELTLVPLACAPTLENLPRLKEAGCEALIYFSAEQESEAWFRALAGAGVKYVCTPSKGYDHFHLEAMRKYGVKGANVPGYSPNAISEHTVLLLLAVLRNLREQLLRIERLDFRKPGTLCPQICDLRIGIVGTGNIGAATIKCLSGFSPACIYAYGHHVNPAITEPVQYVSLEELYRKSDVIIFHCSYHDSNYHMVNADTIRRMKDGAVLINTARGALFDTLAVAEAIKSGKLGGLGMDVIEGEEVLQGSVTGSEFPVSVLRELQAGYNVVFTNHTAFLTERAFRELTEVTMENLLSYRRTGACANEVTGVGK